MSMQHVQTVTGAIKVAELGRTLVHEHIFVAFAGAEYDPETRFDRPAFVVECVKRLRDLRAHGVRTLVDPCPIELGRDVTLLKEVSEKSEVNIVCTTGFYFEAMGLPPYWRRRSAEFIADFYIREIERGVGDTGIRPGAIKCGSGHPEVTELEKLFLHAASIAQKATGVPIITHTQLGTGGPEQQAEFARHGVAPHRCLIGHCCGNPDHAYHRGIAANGSYVGFDRIGMLRFLPDSVRADNVVKLARAGFADRILLSQDRVCHMLGRPMGAPDPRELAASKGVWPGPYTYLFTDFIPLLRERGMTEQEIADLLDENPWRFFAGV